MMRERGLLALHFRLSHTHCRFLMPTAILATLRRLHLTEEGFLHGLFEFIRSIVWGLDVPRRLFDALWNIGLRRLDVDAIKGWWILHVGCFEHKLVKYMLPNHDKTAYLTNNQYVSFAFWNGQAACTYQVCAPSSQCILSRPKLSPSGIRLS